MIRIDRRKYLALLGMGGAASQFAASAFAGPQPAMFSIAPGTTYLNAARLHPLSNPSARAIQLYLEARTQSATTDTPYFNAMEAKVKQAFATLINATPAEIAILSGAQVAENFIVAGLGLTPSAGNIVTDALHYRGSIFLYGEMAKRGFDIRMLKPRDNRIQLDDIARAIDSGTKLVAFSLVAYMNGFEQDLKAVCDLAHAKGALVYADIVQAAGAVPVDVRASGVDICGCAGHKWLMGDKGIGFLYVRTGLLGTRLKRTVFGSEEVGSGFTDHLFAPDSALGAAATWTPNPDAAGFFEVGSKNDLAIAALSESLPWLNSEGVANIQTRRRPLIERLMHELPRLGLPCVTPTSSSSIVSFSLPDKASVEEKLAAQNIIVSTIGNIMRVSPSVYNTNHDVDRLIAALKS